VSDPPLLDWHDRSHWGEHGAPCLTCGDPTPLRNDHKQPQHKVCAERVLAEHNTRAGNNHRQQF
jgi:hypothetical protein